MVHFACSCYHLRVAFIVDLLPRFCVLFTFVGSFVPILPSPRFYHSFGSHFGVIVLRSHVLRCRSLPLILGLLRLGCVLRFAFTLRVRSCLVHVSPPTFSLFLHVAVCVLVRSIVLRSLLPTSTTAFTVRLLPSLHSPIPVVDTMLIHSLRYDTMGCCCRHSIIGYVDLFPFDNLISVLLLFIHSLSLLFILRWYFVLFITDLR